MSDLFSPVVAAPLLLTTYAFFIGEICQVDAKHVLQTFFHRFYLFFKEKLGNLPSWCATLQSTSRIQPPASSCLDERQERQMGSLISSDYISAQRNMKEMQFLHRPPPTSPWSLPRRRIGDFAGKRGNEDRTKVYANHKNWLGFICHSCEGPVLWGKFLAENLKQTQGQPNNKEKATNLCLGFSFPICSLLTCRLD